MNLREQSEANAFGYTYEAVMLRAHKSYDNTKPGLHCSYWNSLINAENGNNYASKALGNYEKQLLSMKKYITKALDKFIKMKKIPDDNREELIKLIDVLIRSNDSEGCKYVISRANILTLSVKDY